MNWTMQRRMCPQLHLLSPGMTTEDPVLDLHIMKWLDEAKKTPRKNSDSPLAPLGRTLLVTA